MAECSDFSAILLIQMQNVSCQKRFYCFCLISTFVRLCNLFRSHFLHCFFIHNCNLWYSIVTISYTISEILSVISIEEHCCLYAVFPTPVLCFIVLIYKFLCLWQSSSLLSKLEEFCEQYGVNLSGLKTVTKSLFFVLKSTVFSCCFQP